jgi:hypothetical protein
MSALSGLRRLPPIHWDQTCIGEGGTCPGLTFLTSRVPLRSTKWVTKLLHRPTKLRRQANKWGTLVPETLSAAQEPFFPSSFLPFHFSSSVARLPSVKVNYQIVFEMRFATLLQLLAGAGLANASPVLEKEAQVEKRDIQVTYKDCDVITPKVFIISMVGANPHPLETF